MVVVLVVGGLGVIGWISRQGIGDVEPPVPPPTPVVLPTATPDPALREQAEASLEQVVTLLGQIHTTAPDRWAGELWEEVTALNDQGDVLMAEEKWTEATETYGQVSKKLEPLVAQVPQVPERLLPLAREEIEQGEKEEADRLVEAVLSVEPGLEEAKALLPRAQVADQSFAAMQRSRAYLEEKQLEDAYVALQKVKELDPEFPGFPELEAEVEAALTQRELSELLGRLTAALDAEDLDTAEAALKEAQQLAPDHPGVQDAAVRVEALSLTRLVLQEKAVAERFTAEEDWQGAYRQWLKIQSLDSEAPWVETGLKTSKQWAVIDAKIQKGMEDPGGRQTRVWLEEFEDQSGWPAGLSRSVKELEQAHTRWTTPVPVVLVSDGETEVTLRRVGRWREIIRKELALLPGEYVAIGGRLGYRDVRVPFRVEPGGAVQEIEVICTEGI